MRSPLSAELADPSRPVPTFWAETAPLERPGAPLEGDVEAEVAILGAGYTGLSCALTLARDYGVLAVALDAGEIGWGASGRNGGIVSMDCTELSMRAKIARVGEEETKRFYAAEAEAVIGLRALIAEEGMACDADGAAALELAATPRGYAAMAERAAYLRDRLGLRVRRIPPEELRAESVDSPGLHGALELRPGFGLHPLKLALGLAEAARRRGAALFPRSPVLRWGLEGSGARRRHLLETPSGSIRARFVAAATNGFTPDGLHPGLSLRIAPTLSNIAVTAPLDPDALEAQGWRETRPLYDDRRLHRYIRMLRDPDGAARLLMGLRGDPFGTAAGAERMRARLKDEIAALFPAWAEVEFSHFWRGPVATTRSGAPWVGRLPDDPTVLHAMGYHGSGVAAGVWCGGALARLIGEGRTGLEGLPLLYRGPTPKYALAALRSATTAAGLAWRRRLDTLGR